jgi:hypothetical protein
MLEFNGTKSKVRASGFVPILAASRPLTNASYVITAPAVARCWSSPTRPGWLAVWTLLALVNLAAGVAISSRPERQTDLESLQRWERSWLVGAVNIYESGDERPDYPPYAIVMLAPLGVLPADRAVPVWLAINLMLAVLAVYLAVLIARPAVAGSDLIVPMLMFLCWGGFRTLLQFSLLTLTFGLAAQLTARKHPVWSGICLGFALMKPQMAAPFVLWALFARRARVLVTAAAVAGLGFVVFCGRAAANPVDVVAGYWNILRTYYVDDASGLVGLAQLRPLIVAAVPNASTATVVAWSVAGGLLAAIGGWGWLEGRRRTSLMSAPALAAIWSLMTFYHLTYGFLILLPVATLLLWAEDPRTLALRTRTFWLMQAALMVDVPGVWRSMGDSLRLPFIAGAALMHTDRVLVVVLLALVAWIGILDHRRLRAVERRRGDDREEHRVGWHA